jgi:hypothetical protein
MVQDFSKVRAFFCHSSRSGLAQPDAMALTGSSNQHIVTLFVDDEVIAGHCVPTETATDF